MGLSDQAMHYGGAQGFTLEQVDLLSRLFAEIAPLRTITLSCSICGAPFSQPPQPYTEKPQFYTCPQHRA